MMLYNTQDYHVFGLFPSGIIKNNITPQVRGGKTQ
jgi:hypothetical protein